jgi:hypothetical protein
MLAARASGVNRGDALRESVASKVVAESIFPVRNRRRAVHGTTRCVRHHSPAPPVGISLG